MYGVYTIWVNSAPSKHYLLNCLAQRFKHSISNRGIVGLIIPISVENDS